MPALRRLLDGKVHLRASASMYKILPLPLPSRNLIAHRAPMDQPWARSGRCEGGQRAAEGRRGRCGPPPLGLATSPTDQCHLRDVVIGRGRG
jgi:hypothetical protein